MAYPVGKSSQYENIIAEITMIEPILHAKSRGLKHDCDRDKNAGTMSSTKTTKTPANCTDEVTVSAKSPKNNISFKSPFKRW